jgi:hypothetical protein
MSDPAEALADSVDAKVLLNVLASVKAGDSSARMPLEWVGVPGKVADGVNDVIIANQAVAAELARVSRVVGKAGGVVPAGGVGRLDAVLVGAGGVGQQFD